MAQTDIRVVDTDAVEHYVWGGNCHGWHLFKDAALGVIEEEMPPGASEVGHHHERAQQFFYVLSGEAVMLVEGVEYRLAAGKGIYIPAGRVHQILNRSSQQVRFLVISQPHSHRDRVVAT